MPGVVTGLLSSQRQPPLPPTIISPWPPMTPSAQMICLTVAGASSGSLRSRWATALRSPIWPRAHTACGRTWLLAFKNSESADSYDALWAPAPNARAIIACQPPTRWRCLRSDDSALCARGVSKQPRAQTAPMDTVKLAFSARAAIALIADEDYM